MAIEAGHWDRPHLDPEHGAWSPSSKRMWSGPNSVRPFGPMSVCGTFRTSRDVRLESVESAKANIASTLTIDPALIFVFPNDGLSDQ
jgi:hypothetical protein